MMNMNKARPISNKKTFLIKNYFAFVFFPALFTLMKGLSYRKKFSKRHQLEEVMAIENAGVGRANLTRLVIFSAIFIALLIVFRRKLLTWFTLAIMNLIFIIYYCQLKRSSHELTENEDDYHLATSKSMPPVSAPSPRDLIYRVASAPTTAQRSSKRNIRPSTTNSTSTLNSTSTNNITTLNPEQQRVLQLALSGKNIFITGAAGVGKTFLLRQIVKSLQDKYSRSNHDSNTDSNTDSNNNVSSSSKSISSTSSNETQNPKVAITAPTSTAASHIDGITLQSWAGIGITSPKDEDVTKLIEEISNNNLAAQRWRSTKTLVIDEISMIDGQLFDALDAIGKQIRGNADQPWGGLQIILSGDFHQLPPVSLRSRGTLPPVSFRSRGNFSFSSDAWKNGNIIISELTTVFRQSADLRFARLLRELREGKCSEEAQALLATCHVSRKKQPTDGILPTKLYSKNENVDAENITQQDALGGTYKSYHSKDKFVGALTNQFENSIQQVMEKKVPSLMQLKLGAQVMLLEDTPEWNLVKGSRGVVIGFDAHEKKKDLPIIRFTNGAVHTIEPFEVFQATCFKQLRQVQ